MSYLSRLLLLTHYMKFILLKTAATEHVHKHDTNRRERER